MFYRTDLIQAAGLTDEDMDSLTWEQFIEIGKKVKQATGVDMIIMCPGGDMEGRIIYQSAGTWFFDANGQENIKNNQAFSDAFATMKSLYQAGIVWDVPGWDDYFAAIANPPHGAKREAQALLPANTAELATPGRWCCPLQGSWR